MKMGLNEPYDKWVERVRILEYGIALQKIANGQDADTVMEDMSKRIIEKIMHPIYDIVRESAKIDYDPVELKKQYEEKMTKHKLVADHIVDE